MGVAEGCVYAWVACRTSIPNVIMGKRELKCISAAEDGVGAQGMTKFPTTDVAATSNVSTQ